LKENAQHRKRNRAVAAIAMEAPVEELTPLGVLKQPKVLGAWFEVWRRFSRLTAARDIKRCAIPMCQMPASPPPAGKFGFDQPYGSVNRARHMRRSRAKRTHEFVVKFRRANASSLDLLQEFSQIHFLVIPCGPTDATCPPHCLPSY
jgi:hypothetical protein